jgi:hypothetical protein
MFELSVPAARINMLLLVARSNDMFTTYGTPKIIETIAEKAGQSTPRPKSNEGRN